MNTDVTGWLRRVSSGELLLMHNIAEVINGTPARTFESRQAAIEIKQGIERRSGRLVQQFDDSANNEEEVETWHREKKRRQNRWRS
jgi:hypothetical protein